MEVKIGELLEHELSIGEMATAVIQDIDGMIQNPDAPDWREGARASLIRLIERIAKHVVDRDGE